MIKFGNDIVTVGGNWLKMPPEPEKWLDCPIVAAYLDAGDLIPVSSGPGMEGSTFRYRNSNYRFTVIKLLYSNLIGELTWCSNNTAATAFYVDIAKSGNKVITPYGYYEYPTPYFTNAISYDGTVNANGVIERTGTSLINRIVYDWGLSKIHFYDIGNNLIASADLTVEHPGVTLFHQCHDEYWNPGSNRTTGNLGAYGWHCSTLAQCLSL